MLKISHRKSHQKQTSQRSFMYDKENEEIQMAKGQLRKAYKGQELALSDKGEEPMAKILIFCLWIYKLRSPFSDSRTNIL